MKIRHQVVAFDAADIEAETSTNESAVAGSVDALWRRGRHLGRSPREG